MKLGRWNIGLSEPWRLRLEVAIPRPTVWVSPRTVLWGGGRWDVQVGSAQDLAREVVLNRRARERREAVTAVLRFRDSATPTFAELARSFDALARATLPVTRTVTQLAEQLEPLRREL